MSLVICTIAQLKEFLGGPTNTTSLVAADDKTTLQENLEATQIIMTNGDYSYQLGMRRLTP